LGVLAVVVLLLGAGLVAWSAGLIGSGTEPRRPRAASPLDVPPPSGLSLPEARPARPVLTPPGPVALDPAAVRTAVLATLRDPDLGRHVGFAAYDLGADRSLWSTGADSTYVPASTLKLLTTAAVLHELDGGHHFETTVVRSTGSGGLPEVVLVGGGDPLLARGPAAAADAGYPKPATLEALVRQTAQRLQASGPGRVSVGYDADLFTGPAVSPAWEPDYVPNDVVTPISALWVDQGLVPGSIADRSEDPARIAAEQFVAALERRGIRVVGRPAPSDASPDARELARVESPTLDQIVQHVLETSNNESSEVLLRHLAIATGRPASFAGGVAALREVLTGLGVSWDGVRVHDGSGLARPNRLPLAALVRVLRFASDPRHPELRAVITNLPVARFNGSLAYRFTDPESRAAWGVARAKTGTLSHVHALAGVTVDRDGGSVAFVAVADRVRLRDTLDARDTLDRIVAALTACSCAR